MSEQAGISFMLLDLTGDEIEISYSWQTKLAHVPRAGETLHFWTDGTATAAVGEPHSRRTFVVQQVTHDVRYMPSGRGVTVHSLVIWVAEITEAEG